MPRILVSAGEPSGDLHGGPVVAALKARIPGVVIEALGGQHLAKAGADVRFRMDRHTVMGLTEIVRAIPAHAGMLHRLESDFRAARYDLALPIDYPGFNLRVAEAARRSGVPVLYYIAPKHWASGRGDRLTRRLARAVDRLACIVPFEPQFFSGYGIAAEYVGHPSLDEPAPDRTISRRALGIGEDQRVLAVLPGSRRQEVARLWGPFRDAARLARAEGACHRVLVAAMAGLTYPECEGFEMLEGQSRLALAAADAAIVKSGTATVEAALAGVPMVVAYRMHPVTAWAARRWLRVPWISMVNLIVDGELVPELLQREVTAPKLAATVTGLLAPASPTAGAQREGFRVMRERLGGPGAAARVVARDLRKAEGLAPWKKVGGQKCSAESLPSGPGDAGGLRAGGLARADRPAAQRFAGSGIRPGRATVRWRRAFLPAWPRETIWVVNSPWERNYGLHGGWLSDRQPKQLARPADPTRRTIRRHGAQNVRYSIVVLLGMGAGMGYTPTPQGFNFSGYQAKPLCLQRLPPKARLLTAWSQADAGKVV